MMYNDPVLLREVIPNVSERIKTVLMWIDTKQIATRPSDSGDDINKKPDSILKKLIRKLKQLRLLIKGL